MQWMEEHGRGFPVGGGVVPIVPAAVLFDLAPLGRFDARPTPAMAREACESASGVVEEGSVGAGTGATVGKLLGPDRCMKGGFGCATLATADGDLIVGAMAAVNALGDVLDARGEIIAGARDGAGGFADSSGVMRGAGRGARGFADASLRNTTLVVVACSAALDAASLSHLANAAGAGLYRRIAPAGTSLDGDLIFAVSPAEGEPPSADAMVIESLGVAVVEQAIERAVRTARGRDGIPGLADPHGH
jgi:L-aminopeptidase/D-esterase-like protein